MSHRLKVFLLDLGTGPAPAGRVFYSETHEEDEGCEPPPGGVRGWFERQLHHFKDRWQDSQGIASRTGRKIWHWLHRRTHPDEVLLGRLRAARAIEVHHPSSMTAHEAAAAWSAFLARGRRRHWLWLAANVLATPVSILLAPLPGPNLIGYWFVYRALHHGLILVGLGRARRGRVTTTFHPAGALDRPGNPRQVVSDPEALDEFLARHGVRTREEDG
jgi:hypothetical protein